MSTNSRLLIVSIGALASITSVANCEPASTGLNASKSAAGNESPQPAPAPIFPKALAPGDTIMFVAPAKYLDKERVSLAKKRLEEMGFKVRIAREPVSPDTDSWAGPTKSGPPSS